MDCVVAGGAGKELAAEDVGFVGVHGEDLGGALEDGGGTDFGPG